jgi:hypothetical protein
LLDPRLDILRGAVDRAPQAVKFGPQLSLDLVRPSTRFFHLAPESARLSRI